MDVDEASMGGMTSATPPVGVVLPARIPAEASVPRLLCPIRTSFHPYLKRPRLPAREPLAAPGAVSPAVCSPRSWDLSFW